MLYVEFVIIKCFYYILIIELQYGNLNKGEGFFT